MEVEVAPTKVLGIVGGLGPLATVAFYATVVRETEAARDQDHLHVLIDSDPSVPDRTAFLLGRGGDPRPRLKEIGHRLKAAGAEVLVMPCNTANVWRAEISEAVGLPVVPWVETALEAVREVGGSPTALLATSGTVASGVYQRVAAQQGVEIILPDDKQQAEVMRVIYGPGGVKNGALTLAIERLGTIIRDLSARGALSVLLACTELPLALGVRVVDRAF